MRLPLRRPNGSSRIQVMVHQDVFLFLTDYVLMCCSGHMPPSPLVILGPLEPASSSRGDFGGQSCKKTSVILSPRALYAPRTRGSEPTLKDYCILYLSLNILGRTYLWTMSQVCLNPKVILSFLWWWIDFPKPVTSCHYPNFPQLARLQSS